MADLTSARRKTMPGSDFAGPDKTFPTNDATHDRLAIGGATRAYNTGHISKAQELRIQAHARGMLKRMKGGA